MDITNLKAFGLRGLILNSEAEANEGQRVMEEREIFLRSM